MQRWLIQLQGEKLDLEEFPRWFPKGEIFAIEEKGVYYLTGPAFDAAASADEVLAKAREALDQYSAVISLLWRPFRKPSISHVMHEDGHGARSAYLFIAGIASARSKMRGEIVDAAGIVPQRQTTQAQDLLSAAQTSQHFVEALHVWADPMKTWGRLYRVIEEIETHFGASIDRLGLSSEAERVRFNRTANTAEAAGLDSRHATGKFQSPAKPMTLEEATAFVSSVLERALRKMVVDQDAV